MVEKVLHCKRPLVGRKSVLLRGNITRKRTARHNSLMTSLMLVFSHNEHRALCVVSSCSFIVFFVSLFVLHCLIVLSVCCLSGE